MARPKKETAEASKKNVIAVPADEVNAMDEFGNETPLTELEPELAGEEVFVEPEAIIPEPVVNPTPAPIYQVVAPKEPNVKILYLDSAIANNQIPIGPQKLITGSGRIFTVTLSAFEGEFMTPLVMKLIDERKFIVLDGLTDEQREQYNCLYKPNEVVRKEGMFDYLISCDTAEAERIFKALCKEHREMVGSRFADAWERHDNRITRDKVEALNKISKKDYEDGIGVFTGILRDMSETY